jgi:hypothetical protein
MMTLPSGSAPPPTETRSVTKCFIFGQMAIGNRSDYGIMLQCQTLRIATANAGRFNSALSNNVSVGLSAHSALRFFENPHSAGRARSPFEAWVGPRRCCSPKGGT